MQGDNEGGPPPAGWYPDPEAPGNRRWWDGLAWSTFTEPMGSADRPGGARGPASPAPPGGMSAPPPSSPAGTWQAGPGARAPGPQIETWLWQSIVATILCCMPLGIPGIVFASQAQSEISVGNHALAREKAAKAKTFTLWSAGVTLVAVFGWFFIAFAGVIAGF